MATPQQSTGLQQTVVAVADDLSVHYRSNGRPTEVLAVRGVTLAIGCGEVVGMVGESGSGKSAFAMVLAGLAGSGHPGSGVPHISGGSLRVVGYDLRRVSHRSRDRVTLRVGFLPQNGAERLSSDLTVAENIAEPIFRRDRNFDTRDAAAAIAILVDRLRLPLSVMQRMPWELSSGQRQRVALARALILEPALLVADEPTRGVDVGVREGVLDALRELRAEREFAALVISSDLAVASEISSRVAVMHQGLLVGLGPIDEVLRAPQHPYVTKLGQAFHHLSPALKDA